ncbi:MAG: protoporphyrinogen oxidase [Elusimicrobia bacterium]|nr:protoporphyrinogen oxidase [Elusimicrobiota bacterium]
MTSSTPHISVIGGGISGLAACHRLLELSREKKSPVQITLFESSWRLGGAIQSTQREEGILELGPDAVFMEKPWAWDLSQRIGLEKEWIGTNPDLRLSFIARKGNLYPLPVGFYLLAPSQFWPLLTTSLFSWKGKWRILREIFVPAKKESGDEGFGSFVRRRFGDELWERVAQPLISAIYSGDAQNLSLEATFPKFLQWEKECGSVIRGLQKQKRSQSQAPTQGPRYSLFSSFSTGLQRIVEKLTEKIPSDSILMGTTVQEIAKTSDPKKLKLVGPHFEMETDAVCLALPATQSAQILRSFSPNLSSGLKKIEYNSVLTVNLLFKTEDVRRPLNGFGFVIPESEKKWIHGCTFSSVKFLQHGQKGKVILRAFLGGKNYEKSKTLNDKKLAELALKDLKELLGITAPPLVSVVCRHPNSLPYYKVGHLEIVKRIEEDLKSVPAIALAGNGFRGIGVPDCIHSGEEAAERIFRYLKV